MANRTAPEIIADLACLARPGFFFSAVDIANMYKALGRLSPEDLSTLVAEISGNRLTVAPVAPPADWNPVMQRGYRVLLDRARKAMSEAVTRPDASP